MPRAFDESEREAIAAALLDAGKRLFCQRGLAKTNVAELAAAAGIGKGSFYLFHPGKEALFLAVHEHCDVEKRARMARALAEARAEGSCVVERFFLEMFHTLEDPFYRELANPEVIQRLIRRVEPARLAAHMSADQAYCRGMVDDWLASGVLERGDYDLLLAQCKSVFALCMQREMIGPDFERMIPIVARAFARALIQSDVEPKPESRT